MTLGQVGHHDSVFIIEGGKTSKSTTIMNTCLSVIQCYRSSKDKHFIRDKVCSMFSLEDVKAARELLFTTCDPHEKYSYNGPHKSKTSETERLHDAFGGIYGKMVKLDAEDLMPKFTVPCEDLSEILALKDSNDHSACDAKFKEVNEKFQKVTDEIKEMSATFHTVISIVTSGGTPTFKDPVMPANPIPPGTRNRLLSTASKRSVSEFSDDDDVQLDSDQNFEIPRQQRKKIALKAKTPTVKNDKTKKTFSDALKLKPKEKLPSTWGTLKSTTSFKGAVPDIFLHSCDVNATTDDIMGHFQYHGVNLRKAEKLSHKDSARSSFKISPPSKEDFDKILTGEFLPEGVAARKFIPRRRIQDDSSKGEPKQFFSSSSNKINEALSELESIQVLGMECSQSQS